MDTRIFFMTGLLLVAFFQAAGATRESQPATAAQPESKSAYAVTGESTAGRLVMYEFLETAPDIPPAYRGDDEGAVLLRQYLWYPHPFSAPGIVAVVTEPSDFRLEFLDEGSERLDSFQFVAVDIGVYFFVLDEPILPVQRCTVRLLLDGKPAGEIEARTSRGFYRM